MGKGIDSLKLKKRSQKLLFMEVKDTDGSHFERLEGFTTQTHNANATEYGRRYVDEDAERTDVTGYSESIGYNFDHYIGQPSLEEIVKITEEELIGSDAVRRILVVDLSSATSAPGGGSNPDGTGNGIICDAYVRNCAIIPSSNGDSTDCMTYSGDFKSRGEKTKCRAHVSADGQTATIES